MSNRSTPITFTEHPTPTDFTMTIAPRTSRTGFTLIELLVVVTIIVLLVAMLLPSLNRSVEMGRAVQCSSQQRQLMVSWASFPVDNAGRLVGAFTRYVPDWVADGADDQYRVETVAMLQAGSLWQYIGNAAMYRCPNERMDSHIRSYSISEYCGGPDYYGVPSAHFVSAIQKPGRMFTFLDEEDPRAYNMNSFVVGIGSIANISASIDVPASFHFDSMVFSYADGHTQIRPNQNAGTTGWMDVHTLGVPAPGSVDLAFLLGGAYPTNPVAP